jgi:hypothetical protein
MRAALFVLLAALLPLPAPAGDSPSDSGAYLQALERLKDAPIDAQVEGWKRFLADHPDTSYRREIETNLKNLEELLSQTDPVQKKEHRDTERYLRAVEYAKRLSPADKILLWEQFLEENPDSIYRSEARKTLDELRGRAPGPPRGDLSPSGDAPPSGARVAVAPSLEYKDRQTAILLATFPGLVVPSLGHWYTRDYLWAGVLTGVRVGGLAIGIPGIVNEDTGLIILGSLLFGVSYLIDVVDAPFSVDRYNEALEEGTVSSRYPAPPTRLSFSLTIPI